MKKLFLMTAIGAMVFASCTSDDLVQNTGITKNQGQIGFNMKVGNTTRAAKAQMAGHYEFGVFADKGSDKATVMANYLVAYSGCGSYDGSGTTTFGDESSMVDGQSYWYYEGINSQILKYWDKSKDNHYFTAYTPYSASTTYDNSTDVLTSSLSSFYTKPETGFQIASAASGSTDDELLNNNEGLYDYVVIAKAYYEKDVPFTFKHINAQIKLKFYEDIAGYNVKLTDMVPTGTADLTAQNGIVLTPAKAEQATAFQQAAETNLPKYLANGTVTVTGVSSTPTIAVSGTGVNSLLYFQEYNDANLDNSSSTAKVCPTTLYVLPNYAGSAYIDGGVSNETGYTLHVSYKLIPEDGAAETQVYDARVWIPADKCQWQAGKCYTYIFKITANSNGTSDPKKKDPAKESEYWIDPNDPRVPEDPDLQPIVFDGVEVEDYTGATTPEGTITDNTMCNALSNAFKSVTSPSGKLAWDLNDNEASITGIMYDKANPDLSALEADLNAIFNSAYLNTTPATVTKINFDGEDYEFGTAWNNGIDDLVDVLVNAIKAKFDADADYTSPTITLSDGNKYYSFELSATMNKLANALSQACNPATPFTAGTFTADIYSSYLVQFDDIEYPTNDLTALKTDLTAIFGGLATDTKITVGTVEYTHNGTSWVCAADTELVADIVAAVEAGFTATPATNYLENITLSNSTTSYKFQLLVNN